MCLIYVCLSEQLKSCDCLSHYKAVLFKSMQPTMNRNILEK